VGPLARRNKLVVRQVPEETLVYDLQRHKAFCLNSTAAQVWKYCDGKTLPGEMAKRLGDSVDERVVWAALKQLSKNQLLEEPVVVPDEWASVTRRRQLATLGKVAAIALPAITAVVAPQAAEAGSCFHAGHGCGTSAQCCSGLCSAGHCVGG
jgi:hypothetical protein